MCIPIYSYIFLNIPIYIPIYTHICTSVVRQTSLPPWERSPTAVVHFTPWVCQGLNFRFSDGEAEAAAAVPPGPPAGHARRVARRAAVPARAVWALLALLAQLLHAGAVMHTCTQKTTLRPTFDFGCCSHGAWSTEQHGNKWTFDYAVPRAFCGVGMG